MSNLFLRLLQKTENLGLVLLLSVIAAISVTAASAQSAADAPPGLTAREMTVPDTLSFAEKIKRHADIVSKADAIRSWALMKRDGVLAVNGPEEEYAAYNEEWLNANKVLLPYSVANEQAIALKQQSYALDISKAKVCKLSGESAPVDPMAATMMFYQELAAGKERQSSSAAHGKAAHGKYKYRTVTCGTAEIDVQGQDVCIIIDLLRNKPLDVGTLGILPAARDAVIPRE
jgi:hypothetical protein